MVHQVVVYEVCAHSELASDDVFLEVVADHDAVFRFDIDSGEDFSVVSQVRLARVPRFVRCDQSVRKAVDVAPPHPLLGRDSRKHGVGGDDHCVAFPYEMLQHGAGVRVRDDAEPVAEAREVGPVEVVDCVEQVLSVAIDASQHFIPEYLLVCAGAFVGKHHVGAAQELAGEGSRVQHVGHGG